MDPSGQTWGPPPVQDTRQNGHVFPSIPDGPPHYPASPYGPSNLTERPGHRYPSQNVGSGLAIACLTLGIIGFFSGFLLVGIALDVLAVILGILSLTNGKPKKGMAIAGILISLSSILLTLLFYAFIGRIDQPVVDYPEQIELPQPPPAPPSIDSSALVSHISMEEYDMGNGVIVIFENGNASDVDLTLRTAYYDEAGKMISFKEDYLWGCSAHGRAATQVSPPYDKQYNTVPYDRYEIEIVAEASDSSYYVPGVQSDLDIQADLDTRGNVLASVRSLSGESYSCVDLSCIFYVDQRPVGISRDYLWDFEKKEVAEFYPPYDDSYQEMDFDTFEVIVNNACFVYE